MQFSLIPQQQAQQIIQNQNQGIQNQIIQNQQPMLQQQHMQQPPVDVKKELTQKFGKLTRIVLQNLALVIENMTQIRLERNDKRTMSSIYNWFANNWEAIKSSIEIFFPGL